MYQHKAEDSEIRESLSNATELLQGLHLKKINLQNVTAGSLYISSSFLTIGASAHVKTKISYFRNSGKVWCNAS